MAAQDDLWAYAKSVYDADGLVTLTNIRDRSATAIDETVGTAAALSAIRLWPAYAQVAFDETDGLHLEVGAKAVIAVLWERGGTSSSIEQVKWDTVFGDDGMVSKVRRTNPRGRPGPSSNSGTITTAESGTQYGWSDPASMPPGFLPRKFDKSAEG